MTIPQLYDGFLPGRHIISGFGQFGFHFAGISHQGSLLALPSGVHRWAPANPFVHEAKLYAAVFAEPLPIDVLLIGTGTMPVPLRGDMRSLFRERGISVDTMTTGAAASTYNVLLSENRRVAAALVAVA
jgi:uncharacterized protein